MKQGVPMGDVTGGMSAKDFLSSAEVVVANRAAITRLSMAKSKIKPFIATSEDDMTSIVSVTLKTAERGSYVTVNLEDELIEAGATGNVDFSGSKELLKSIKMLVKIDMYQHSTKSEEMIINIRNATRFKSRAKTALTNWGTVKFDKIFFSIMTANSTNIVACGHHSDMVTTNIIKADVLTTSDIDEAKRRGLLGLDAAGNATCPPLLPVRVIKNENLGFYDDVEIFVMFVGTNSSHYIKQDPNWDAARKEALQRSEMNPIFTGALGLHNGVLLLDVKTQTARQSGVLTSKSDFHGFGNAKSFDPSTYAGAAGQETEINLLVGACAAQLVVDENIAYYEWADKDDPRILHAGIDRVCGFAKTKYEASQNDGLLAGSIFDNKDYGSIAVIASTGK